MARGTIRRRSKSNPNSWEVQIYLGHDPLTGKKRYRSRTVHGSRDDAERLLTEMLREKDGGVMLLPTGMTVGQYLEEWLHHSVIRVRPRTLQGYRDHVRRYINPRIGSVQLKRLTPRHVRNMEADLLEHGGLDGRSLSPRTVLQSHRTLSSSLTQAVKLDLVPRNVASLVEAPRVSRHEIRTLTLGEVQFFLSQISNPVHRNIILLAVQTGLRRSEIAGLQWRDVDFPAGTISVRRSVVRLSSGKLVVSETKSSHGRGVPLVDDSIEMLRVFRDNAPEDDSRDSFIFKGWDGGPMQPGSITQVFRRAVNRAGLAGLRFHDLRHTHASLMLAMGVHLKVVSERLGHSSIAITGDIYSHVLPSVQLEAVERFGEFWRNSEEIEGLK